MLCCRLQQDARHSLKQEQERVRLPWVCSGTYCVESNKTARGGIVTSAAWKQQPGGGWRWLVVAGGGWRWLEVSGGGRSAGRVMAGAARSSAHRCLSIFASTVQRTGQRTHISLVRRTLRRTLHRGVSADHRTSVRPRSQPTIPPELRLFDNVYQETDGRR